MSNFVIINENEARHNFAFINLDTYDEAETYASKKRSLRPIDYSEISPEKPCAVSVGMTRAKTELKIKIERLTNLNKALLVLNLQNDKRRVQLVTDSDLEEIEDIMDTEPNHEPGIRSADEAQTAHDADNEVVIILGFEKQPPQPQPTISVGVEPLEVDEDLSLQYSFTVDVS